MTFQRYLTFALAALSIPASIQARNIGPAEAREIASAFFADSPSRGQLSEASVGTLSTTSSVRPYYVFNADSDRGFVIVAGDDRLGTILGYSDSGSFSLGPDAPDGLVALMELYTRYMAEAPDSPTATADSPGTPVVSPLLGSIAWGQDKPFNSLCPTYSQSGATNNYYTGCVVTAATQIMKFYNYPSVGTGSKSYSFSGNTLSADFGATRYDWDNMPAAVPEAPSTDQTTAYSTLAAHFGVAVEMQYAIEGSGAYTMLVPAALRDYFGYDAALRMHPRDYYNSSEWMDMIRSELNAGRPVYYAASSDSGSGGHAFVCDGYDSNDFVHINWGWYGRSNGYFLINHLDPSSLGEGGGTGGYNRQQEIITGIRPALQGSVRPITVYGSSRLAVTDYVSEFTMMSFVENLDTEPVNGLVGALLLDSSGQVAKVLGSQAISLPAFSAGHSGNASVLMRNISTAAPEIPDGTGFTLRMGVLPDGGSEWTVLRHSVGLPSYAEADVVNGRVVITSTHSPAPAVRLLSPITTDGDLYAGGTASVRLELVNESPDFRLKNITVRLTSETDPSVTCDITSPVNVYDLSTEILELGMQLPEDIAPGYYDLTAFESSAPAALFDDSKTGRGRVKVLADPGIPVIRLTETPFWQNSDGESVAAHGEYLYIGAKARNYAADGDAALIARFTDINDPEHSYIFLRQNRTCTKAESFSLAFYRKVPVDPGTYRLEISALGPDGSESPVGGYDEPLVIEVIDRQVADIEVLDFDMPSSLAIGERVACSLKFRARKAFRGTIYVRLRQFTNTSGEIVYMAAGQNLAAGEEKTISFNYRPAVTAGSYMPVIESRPSTASIGNENPAANLQAFYREITVTDISGIGSVKTDASAITLTRPAPGIIAVSAPEAVRSIEVYNPAGLLVARSGDAQTVSIAALPAGIYLVRVTTERLSDTLKTIIY